MILICGGFCDEWTEKPHQVEAAFVALTGVCTSFFGALWEFSVLNSEWRSFFIDDQNLGYKLCQTQLLKQIIKTFFCVLENGKAKFTAFRHIGHHFDWPAKIKIGMPCSC